MPLLQRVTKVVRETDEMVGHDHEAIARAAIATVFNWLDEPTEEAVKSAALAAHTNPRACLRMWHDVLTSLRHEAGY
jgi:hypothetical protein